MRQILLALLFGTALVSSAFAQSNVLLNYRNSTTTTVQVSPTNPLPVTAQAVATGGWTQKWFVAANSDNATALKNGAGIVHSIQVYGIGSSPAYLKFYDKGTTPTCASDTIVKQIMIPAASTAALGAGSNVVGIDAQFTTGISYCVVTGIGATDDTSVAAATFIINIDYK